MNGVTTFADINAGLSYLQGKYGTIASGQYEYIRQPFYSYQQYPVAGNVQFTFFTQAVGGTVTYADTNMITAGVFQGDRSLLVMSISCKFRLLTYPNSWTGTDATTIQSDLLMGFAQAGVLSWDINSFSYLQLPRPFLYAPPADGEPDSKYAGAVSATVGAPPQATLNSRRYGLQLTRPVLIENGMPFQVTIGFPTGAVPVIATSIVDDATNPLKIGVELDGILFRPVGS